MKRPLLFIVLICYLCAVPAGPAAGADAWYAAKVKKDERCAVCGMFVAKYPAWIAKIRLANGATRSFDGVKDMLVFYFSPAEHGADAAVKDIMVKDYYTLQWIDGRKAFYVVGSDVYGPMGHEFIPFSSREAAESFAADHHGRQVLVFERIGRDLVESMRAGHRMR